jgi:hypothetical protein
MLWNAEFCMSISGTVCFTRIARAEIKKLAAVNYPVSLIRRYKGIDKSDYIIIRIDIHISILIKDLYLYKYFVLLFHEA